ncbi:MAG: hypothetical protein ABII07_04455 [Patescibacteria group bacterium]|nr:hypothetical protein [Patescibacteria group bacterium]
MSVVPMQKIQIIGIREQLDTALKLLQKKKILEIHRLSEEIIEKISPAQKHDHDLELKLANLDFAIKLLSNYEKKGLFPDPIILKAKNLEAIAETFNYEEVIQLCQGHEEKLVEARNRLTAIEQEETTLVPWKNLEIHLDTPTITTHTKLILGVASKMEYEDFKAKIAKLNAKIEFETISEDPSKSYFSLIHLLSDTDQVNEVLTEFRIQETELETAEGTIKKHLKDISKEAAQLKYELEKIEKELTRLSKNLDSLKIVHDYYLWQLVRAESRDLTGETQYTFVLTGWAKKEQLKDLKNELKEKVPGVAIVEVQPAEGEAAPVELRNTGMMHMFETVTRIYGLPLPTEIDPTPLLAGFFIIYFGLCLSDSGYGFLLFAISFCALKFLKIPKASQGLLKVLMWGGLVTFVAGILLGGYFGLTPEQAPEFLTKTIIGDDGQEALGFKGQIINPVGSGAIIFLGFAFVLGIIQVLFGIAVDGLWKIKDKKYLDAALDSGLWILFLLSLLFLGATGSVEQLAAYGDLSKYLALGLTVALILTQGRKSKSIIGKFGLGVLSLYNVVGYFSDVLSYSRIMALGLGTGIIAFAMNTIAGIVTDLIPYVGFIFGIIVIILGHTLNIALSTLGAFIHSARLQYVEFFGKFMEGGGRDFKPFERECKYTHVKE